MSDCMPLQNVKGFLIFILNGGIIVVVTVLKSSLFQPNQDIIQFIVVIVLLFTYASLAAGLLYFMTCHAYIEDNL